MWFLESLVQVTVAMSWKLWNVVDPEHHSNATAASETLLLQPPRNISFEITTPVIMFMFRCLAAKNLGCTQY